MMIKASKQKIVFFIMLFLAAFLLCSIGVIYGVSYYSIYRENQEIGFVQLVELIGMIMALGIMHQNMQ